MATWVEDIVQALKNLGGQAHRKDILEEIRRIRSEPLPLHAIEVMQAILQAHSPDSAHFQGKDLFRKVGNGVWALRNEVTEGSLQVETIRRTKRSAHYSSTQEEGEVMTTWVEDIIRALKNLGGEATNAQICQEVKRIRKGPFPKSWQGIVNHVMGEYSSDSVLYRGGRDLFKKVGGGVWSLRDYSGSLPSPKPLNKHQRSISFQNFITPESLEEIDNILRTIKQYRDYQSPDHLAWKEYVKEFFQILGFATEEINPRLYTLDVLGSNHTPEAVLLVLHPGENFEEIVPDLPWESYCFLAAQHYRVKWGIITNGIQLKVMSYDEREKIEPLYWEDIDRVICNEQIDTFCSIYKVFSYIKVRKGKAGVVLGGEKKGENLRERHILRIKFWEQLLEKAKKRTKLHAKVKPHKENWIKARSGVSGLSYRYVVHLEESQVDLFIDTGDAKRNKEIFNSLLNSRSEIEQIFGEPLDWQMLPNNRESIIRYLISDYGLSDEEHWDELQDKLIDAMIRLERAIQSSFI